MPLFIAKISIQHNGAVGSAVQRIIWKAISPWLSAGALNHSLPCSKQLQRTWDPGAAMHPNTPHCISRSQNDTSKRDAPSCPAAPRNSMDSRDVATKPLQGKVFCTNLCPSEKADSTCSREKCKLCCYSCHLRPLTQTTLWWQLFHTAGFSPCLL